jgi:hypothetical protein
MWSAINHVEKVYLFIYTGNDMGRAYSTNWVKRNAYRKLVGKPGGKRPIGRPKRG